MTHERMRRNLNATALLWALLVAGTAMAAVIDGGAPLAPGGLQAINIQRTKVTLKWTAPAEDPAPSYEPSVTESSIRPHLVDPTWSPSPSPSYTPLPCTSYDIRYSTAPINGTSWAAATQLAGEPAPATPGVQQTFEVTGLSASTLYYFAVRAIDDVGSVGPLALVSATTAADTVAPAVVTGLIVADHSDNGVTLRWTAPADDDGAKVASYDLRFAMGSIDGASWASATPLIGEPEPKAPGTLETMTIADLGDGAHAFALIAYDLAGNPGPVSASAIVTLTGRLSSDEAASSPCSQSAAAGSAALLALAVVLAIRR